MDRARQKLILALDYPAIEPAFEVAQQLASAVGMFKINIHLFTAAGPAAVEKIRQFGPHIFLDLKFHDIPNTVSGAVRSAIALPGIQLLDVHASGGLEMMRAAAAARDTFHGPDAARPKVIAITILTSLDNASMRAVGIAGPASRRVVSLARLAQKAGLDGVVASPQEVKAIQASLRQGFSDCRPRHPAVSRRRQDSQAAEEDGRSIPSGNACRGDSQWRGLSGGGPANHGRA